MSEEPISHYRIINQRDQPVELHLSGRVVMLPAMGHLELSREEQGAPQIQILAQQRLLTVEPVHIAPPTPVPVPAKPKTRRRKKP